MRFEVNISILFKEHPFAERFAAAKDAGFSAVEFWWPSGENLGEIEAAIESSGVEVALFNFDAGDMAAGDRGLAGDPERYERFLENVPAALELAEKIGCRKLNALVGHELPGRREEQLELAAQNVRYAAGEAEKRGIGLTVEAVNTFENGAFLLHTTAQGMEFVRRVGRENVGFQYDVYHMQRMEGNLIANLRANIAGISHVQIADSPDRREPGTGEINFARVLAELEAAGYKGHVGLEYNPTGEDTLASLDWIPGASRSGDADLNSLGL
ncbi:hydroxypyruvate isomerase family protein [Rubrobacter indicoceani]|uniref:hydroxypyruvate isomerase family protein n=1 Tax=Rubrobacter indicoceani TaxID=2051957 RepID=UPI000E5A6314|nr:TIM barrel protein [Rubrobacter indicoceani]